jgi:hypothetical protein
MHSGISVVHDSKRGCGFRKTHGLYFRTDDAGVPCDVLPLELKPCPVCAAMGLKCKTAPTRGFSWVKPSGLFNWNEIVCPNNVSPSYGEGLCGNCSMSKVARLDKCGLLWVGEKFYPTPADFDRESNSQGISRRLPHDQIPRGFKVGEDFIMLAHRKAIARIEDGEGTPLFPDVKASVTVYYPGVFRIFRPSRIECVVTGDEPDDFIDALIERGITPVKVVKNG